MKELEGAPVNLGSMATGTETVAAAVEEPANRCCHRTNPSTYPHPALTTHRLVGNAGLLVPATLARHLGLRELVDHHLDLAGGRAGTGEHGGQDADAAVAIRRWLAATASGDDADALRAGSRDGRWF